VDVFSIVNQFIYTRQLSEKLESDLEWEMSVRAWIFGDKYLMPSLHNRVMSVLIEKTTVTDQIPTSELELIYSNTLPGSPLRKMIVDMTAYEGDMVTAVTSEGGKRWPHEALLDLMTVIGSMRCKGIGKFVLPKSHQEKCFYHIHPDGETCDAKL
jgi:hypothetical protein